MKESAHHILDHITDAAGIAAISYMSYSGTATPEAIGAVVTIATGARYLKGKFGSAYSSQQKESQ
jgi:hypothetical protein